MYRKFFLVDLILQIFAPLPSVIGLPLHLGTEKPNSEAKILTLKSNYYYPFTSKFSSRVGKPCFYVGFPPKRVNLQARCCTVSACLPAATETCWDYCLHLHPVQSSYQYPRLSDTQKSTKAMENLWIDKGKNHSGHAVSLLLKNRRF